MGVINYKGLYIIRFDCQRSNLLGILKPPHIFYLWDYQIKLKADDYSLCYIFYYLDSQHIGHLNIQVSMVLLLSKVKYNIHIENTALEWMSIKSHKYE